MEAEGLVKEAPCRGSRGGLSKRLLAAEVEGACQGGLLSRKARGLIKEAPFHGGRGACQGGSSSQKPRVLIREALVAEAEGLVRRLLFTEAAGVSQRGSLSRTPRGLVKETSCHGSRGSFITVTAASSGAGRQGKRGFFYCKVRRVMVFFSCKIRSPRFITVNTGERFRP